MPKHGLILSIIDIEQALRRPNGGSTRFRLLLDAAVAACDAVRVVTFAPSEGRPIDSREIAPMVQEAWGLRAHFEYVPVPPIPVSRRALYLSPVVSASTHPEFARYRTGVVQRAISTELSRHPGLVVVRDQPLAGSYVRFSDQSRPAHMDVADIAHRKHARMIAAGEVWGPRWVNSLQHWSRRHYDRTVMAAFSSCFVCSEVDRQYCEQQLGLRNAVVIPNAMEQHVEMPLTGSRTLLFVGSLGYAPNSHALQILADRIMPALAGRFADLELLVAGEAPASIRRRYDGRAGMTLLGFVDDLDAVYARSRVVVCPLVTGGGTRVKLIEAAMRGKPIVTTRVGSEGLGLVDGVHVLEAESHQSFAEACSRLLLDDALARRLGTAARLHTEQHFAFSAVRDRLASLFERA